jgi:hypothetical protein
VGEVISAPRQATSTALSAPIGFPPLIEATVPGDQVVIAVDRGIPQAPAIVAGIIDSLASGRIEPADVRVVLASGFVGAEEITELLPDIVGKAITIEQHNAHDKDHLCYLAASSDAKPIFFNRSICEADLVIPIGCLRPDGALGYLDDAMGLALDKEAIATEAAATRAQTPAAELTRGALPEKIDDPVRMYLTQMGEIPLLTRDQEIFLAKTIEITRKRFRKKCMGSGISMTE